MTGVCWDGKPSITIVNNRLIQDVILRYEDIGLLVYILSKSESNIINFNDLVKSHSNNRVEVINILKRLTAKGYLHQSDHNYSPEDYVFIDCTKEGW